MIDLVPKKKVVAKVVDYPGGDFDIILATDCPIGKIQYLDACQKGLQHRPIPIKG